MTFMAQRFFSSVGMVAAAALLVSSCTIKEQETPDLSGPSEFGTAIVLSASPDILTQDGASQSMITVTTRDFSPIQRLDQAWTSASVMSGTYFRASSTS